MGNIEISSGELSEDELLDLEAQVVKVRNDCQRAGAIIGDGFNKQKIPMIPGIIAMRAIAKDQIKKLDKRERDALDILESIICYGDKEPSKAH